MVRCFAALSIRSAEAVITAVSARWAEEDGAGADARKGAGAEFETISGVCYFFPRSFFPFFPPSFLFMREARADDRWWWNDCVS